MREFLRVGDILERVLTWVTNALLVWVTLSTFGLVVARYLFNTGSDLLFAVARVSSVTFVYLIIGVIVRHNEHINLTIVTDRIGPGMKHATSVFNDIVVLAFACAFTFWSLQLTQYTLRQTTESINFPGLKLGFLYIPLIVGGALWILYSIERLLRNTLSKKVDQRGISEDLPPGATT